MANGRVTSTSGCRAVVCPSLSQRAARRVDGFACRRATDPATFSNGCGLPQRPPSGRRLPVAVLAPVHSTAARREVPAGRCAVLCCAVLCCAVLCCAVLCCAVLCCAVLCCAVLCCAVLCCAVLCCAV